MRIKSFNEYITEELRKVISDQSGSGKTKSIDWIWDEPSSAKSPRIKFFILVYLSMKHLKNLIVINLFEMKAKGELFLVFIENLKFSDQIRNENPNKK